MLGTLPWRTLFVSFLATLWVLPVASVGCGQPFNLTPFYISIASSFCTDWQCSRAVTTAHGNVGISFIPMAEENNASISMFYCVRGFAVGEDGCTTDNECYRGGKCGNGKCIAAASLKKPLYGFLGIAAAIVCFGSNFLPVKKIEMGNGVFFQFIMACGITTVGIAVQLIRGAHTFYPPAMLGGMMWALGNTLCVPVIQCVGMGIGLATWGSSNLVMGWASGKFGIWGVKAEQVETEWLSYMGIGIALAAIAVFALVRPSVKRNPHSSGYLDDDVSEIAAAGEDRPLRGSEQSTHSHTEGYLSLDPTAFRRPTRTFPLGPASRRFFGFLGAVGAGVCFGVNMDTCQAMMSHYAERSLTDDAKFSPDGLDYVFSHFTGILLTAGSLAMLFFAAEHRLPTIFNDIDHASIVVPAFASGVIWGIAQVSWFIANTNLGLVVSFPSIGLGPSVVANLWGVLLFREVRGWRNLSLLALAICLVGGACASAVVAKGSPD